jgi:hypothetical protein
MPSFKPTAFAKERWLSSKDKNSAASKHLAAATWSMSKARCPPF